MSELSALPQIDRIEKKVDKLTETVSRLVLIEERQSTLGARVASVEDRQDEQELALQDIDRKVDKWINRGFGLWAAVATGFAVWQAWPKG